ncbi:MAG TPA: tyrosine--tRNA ligase [Ktedonobacteraceae bacterium]|nr:tyrosine--tRNA ligase [Ktedonobacteraceae bacterium]
MGMTNEELLVTFERTTHEMFTLAEFRRLLTSGRQLRIKYGVDVTAPYLHIGHAVNLWMMRQMQEMGHKVIFLIGDFTTRIGDPTGRDLLRPVLPAEEIARNSEAFIEQARMVLRFDDPQLLEIRRNSEWYNCMTAEDLLRLFTRITHARLISRDMFQTRIQQERDIYMHEMLYPVLQGYDSVALQSDLTIIGSDQLFNEMLGRFYQEHSAQAPQVIITTKITPGIDGKAKQSKSLDNYIGLGHSPREKFGRTMKLPDELIVTYLEIYTEVPLAEIAHIKASLAEDPMHAKLFLAHEIVKRYHGAEVADQEQLWFRETFSERAIPRDIPELHFVAGQLSAFEIVKRFFGTQKSNSEIRRLFDQGAIARNGARIAQSEEMVEVSQGDEWRVGKRAWFRVQTS